MSQVRGVEITSRASHEAFDLLSDEALKFISELVDQFQPRIQERLLARQRRQAEWNAGVRPNFLSQTQELRNSKWTVAPLPQELWDRRVEITGPTDRKMMIQALNSSANVFMADLEDATSPTWNNILDGQFNLKDAVRKKISWTSPEGKMYQLGPRTAVLMVRPRGLHMLEKHVLRQGAPIAAALFDFGLFTFHNAHALVAQGKAPYFYLPKLESHLEARLWNDIFNFTQQKLNIPQGTFKATVLIETVPAAFEMDEILFELKEHSAGLNCGRWDYLFSFIKCFREDSRHLTCDRSELHMSQPFLRAYSQLLIATCHKRNVHAMGGMAAQIPIKDSEAANALALAKVRADKEREAQDGHDGTWVAHPGLVSLAKEVFDAQFKTPNQIHLVKEVSVRAEDLLNVPQGHRTEQGLRHNVKVALIYLSSWLAGKGCVPIENLMEDAATAEICRTQLWQWVHHQARLDDGREVTPSWFEKISREELEKLPSSLLHREAANKLLSQLVTSQQLEEFLTVAAYPQLP